MSVLAGFQGRFRAWFLSHYAFVGLSRQPDGRAEAQWLKVSGQEIRDPFFKTSVDRVSQRVQAGALVKTGADALLGAGR